MDQLGFFHESDALRLLSKLGDKLEWLNAVINWNIFVPLLDKAKPDRTQTEKGGRPPLPNLMMFKVIILQMLYNVADDQTEFLINDRLSWRRFLGMSLSDKAPDAKSIWDFRERLTNSGIYDQLFTLFNQVMDELGVITHKGTIEDASFVDVPRQRNTRKENEAIKENEIPEGWLDPENAAKLAQKDLDARWAKKNDELHYGYKDHVAVDAESKMIEDYRVTAASVHDSQMTFAMIGNRTSAFFADSAYTGKEILEKFATQYPEIKINICEKGYKNRPLTEDQKQNNREKSKTRCRVEHTFGHMTNSMGGMFIRCIGEIRAESAIALKNLAYNISRYATLRRLNRAPSMA